MNILLVEDDGICRNTLKKFLSRLGHHVLDCANGQEALKLFRPAKFHMVLSDINMPKMTGMELLQEISSMTEARDVDVVLFTGQGNMHSVLKALRLGAYDYLVKPINFEELTIVIERVAARQALVKENRFLCQRVEENVRTATKGTRLELAHLRMAFARVVGMDTFNFYSDTMKEIYMLALKYHADRSIPILIQGETGTGKELIAKIIHYGNFDKGEPFIDINCSTLSATIFESELFGYEGGSFTGALPKGKKGKFDLAAGGTLFLDEIGEITVDLQAKLLRVIQERSFYRMGGLKKIKSDARIICATNVDIDKKVKEGTFRQDLYYRLSVGMFVLPPLRERKNEILPLAKTFLRTFAHKRGKQFMGITDQAAKVLISYNWPGNVRELKNVMDRVTLLHDDYKLKPGHLDTLQYEQRNERTTDSLRPIINPEGFSLPAEGLNLNLLINRIIDQALETHGGNKTKAAQFLGMTRRSLQYRVEGK